MRPDRCHGGQLSQVQRLQCELGYSVYLSSPHFWLLLFQLLSSPHWQQQKLTLSGWTACSSRMLLVLGQCLGFLYTPTTPFHQAGIPATINQRGDSPWMSVNTFPSLPLFPATFLSPFHSFSTVICCLILTFY